MRIMYIMLYISCYKRTESIDHQSNNPPPLLFHVVSFIFEITLLSR